MHKDANINVSPNSGNAMLPAQPYRLFLDDIREPWQVGNYIYPVELRKEFRLHEWVVVRNYVDFVKCIKERGLPTHISFDHDLADCHYLTPNDAWLLDPSLSEAFEETGYDAAKWLCEYLSENKLPLPVCYVHSSNPVGKENIEALLGCFQRACR